MKCPECEGLESRVANCRQKANNTTHRRRECLNCGHRWTTYEISADALNKNNNQDLIDLLSE
jgi:transcriptional repressor NrdR